MRKNKGVVILPAVLEKSSAIAWDKLQLFDGIAPEIQLDILDGKLVDKMSYPYTGESLKERLGFFTNRLDESQMEIHLMLKNNMDFIQEYSNLLSVASKVVLQVESSDTEIAIKTLKNRGFTVAVSIMMETDLGVLDKYTDTVDYVQFMSIDKIGVQGSQFDSGVFDRIKRFKEQFPNITIAVDGGVSESNILKLISSGATRFAVGSAIFKTEDPVATWKKMSEILTGN